jgi:hypothetical protein
MLAVKPPTSPLPTGWQHAAHSWGPTTSSKHSATGDILGVLALAAETAAASGHPLQLHTLRVLGCGPSLPTTGRLLAGLPHLHCLHLPDLNSRKLGAEHVTKDVSKVQQQLAPLQHAKQLVDLQLPEVNGVANRVLSGLLPLNLQRLSWQANWDDHHPHLTHLKQLTFLQLACWRGGALSGTKLPAALRELDLSFLKMTHEIPQEQLQLVSVVNGAFYLGNHPMCDISGMSNLTALLVDGFRLSWPSISTAVAQLSSLSALTIQCDEHDVRSTAPVPFVVSFPASLQGLRRLEIQLYGWRHNAMDLPGLSCLTQLTRLAVSIDEGQYNFEQQFEDWGQELRELQSLKWLSVPDLLLLEEDQSWMGDLLQLQVLQVEVLFDRPHFWGSSHVAPDSYRDACVSRMQQLPARASLCALPPQLLLLMVTGVPAHLAASFQLRRHLQQQLVGRAECEVVVAVCDPTRRLVGLPEALQERLEALL